MTDAPHSADEQLVGCGNWEPKHGIGLYCANCGFHESEHRDTYPYARAHPPKGWGNQKVEIGFGIPFLAELVRIRMEKHGRSLDVAIDSVARGCELRSEAIQELREHFEKEQSQ